MSLVHISHKGPHSTHEFPKQGPSMQGWNGLVDNELDVEHPSSILGGRTVKSANNPSYTDLGDHVIALPCLT